jgi:membrane-bound ClpP family serine protease
MHWVLIATFIIIGLLFLALEILVIPGVGVAGVIGFILVAVGVWQAYAWHGMLAGHLVLGGTLALTVLTLVLSLRGKTWRRLALSASIDSKVNVIDEEKVKPGDTGRTVSRLAPMGKALINDEFYEVSTNGDFIDQQTEITVLKVEYSKIIVKRKE